MNTVQKHRQRRIAEFAFVLTALLWIDVELAPFGEFGGIPGVNYPLFVVFFVLSAYLARLALTDAMFRDLLRVPSRRNRAVELASVEKETSPVISEALAKYQAVLATYDAMNHGRTAFVLAAVYLASAIPAVIAQNKKWAVWLVTGWGFVLAVRVIVVVCRMSFFEYRLWRILSGIERLASFHGRIWCVARALLACLVAAPLCLFPSYFWFLVDTQRLPTSISNAVPLVVVLLPQPWIIRAHYRWCTRH